MFEWQIFGRVQSKNISMIKKGNCGIAPTTWVNAQRFSNPSTTSFDLCSWGICTYLGSKRLDIMEHVLLTIVHTVEIPSPNNAEIVLYSMLVPNLHMVTASCVSTGTGHLIFVTCLWMWGPSLVQSSTKLRQLAHSWIFVPPTLSKYSHFGCFLVLFTSLPAPNTAYNWHFVCIHQKYRL